MNKRVLFLLLSAVLLPSTLIAQQAAQPHKTVWDGVYTEAQADRGRDHYMMHCSPCHGNDLEGLNGARLSGAEFMERWREYDIHSLYEFISKSMPRRREGSDNRPGSLGETVYMEIVSHILRSNQFPSGGAELTLATMPAIQIEGKAGPKPLPNGALAQLVGCLEPGRTSGWRLTNASEPTRTSVSKNSTAGEFATAQAKPLGHLEFRLTNLEYVAPAFDPKDHVGQKIQLKGFLVRQPGNERVDITSMEVAGERCTQ
jgi:hypothetical protein